MNKVKLSVMGIAMFLLPAFMSACVTVSSQPQVKASIVAKAGDTIYMFHGGNKPAKEEFCLNEVVPVYRYFGRRYKQAGEVGQIRITGYVGEHYLEGVVVKGKIKDDDVAMKSGSACLIRLPDSDGK